MERFANGAVRLLKHHRSIVEEDDLDRRWKVATGEHVDEVMFLSRHTAVSNRPALTVHPIGTKNLSPMTTRFTDRIPSRSPLSLARCAAHTGGRPGWAGPPKAQEIGLIPEFEIIETAFKKETIGLATREQHVEKAPRQRPTPRRRWKRRGFRGRRGLLPSGSRPARRRRTWPRSRRRRIGRIPACGCSGSG
ncbi:unnamed protein product [Musa acuminata subsp. burmannicoides]